MRIIHPTELSIVYRFVFISTLVAATLAAFGELGRSLSSTSTVVSASAESASASNSIATYHWNLDQAGLPLLSLPEHISGAVDLSITYSMDQFQFPLFQSLYYNERAGKYILMVMPKDNGSAEFIDLTRIAGRRRFQAPGHSGLRLEDEGHSKFLITGEGTVYTFAPFGNGEFHCSRISDRNGVIISLEYTKDASIQLIADVSGRTIRFGYEKNYLTSITQTWGPASVKKQTWAVGNTVVRIRPAVHLIPAAAKMSKRIPTNALTQTYTKAMVDSDLKLANIFGGPNAVAAASGFEPVGLGSQYPLYRGDVIGDDGQPHRGHLSFAMHLYGSGDGTGDTDLYVPSGFTSHSSMPTPTDAAVTFYYPRLGNLSNVTLAVFHIANFGLSYEEGGRVRIGNIGGPGGSVSYYKHSHIEFYRGYTGLPSGASRPGLRIDPATVFETPANLVSLSTSGTSTHASH